MGKGRLIVLEGIDGSGKSTQYRLLLERFRKENIEYHSTVFPRYNEESSALIRLYLGGAFGDKPSDVNACAAASFFAVDRYAAFKQDWGGIYNSGGLILSDRYTTSNAVHQGCKVSEPELNEFFDWLYDFEHVRLGLPQPDLVLYLDVPTELTEQLMRSREQATGTHADIHEKDLAYLRTCRETASQAADYYGWTRIACVRDGVLRSIEDIHAEIYRHVKNCLEG